MTYLRKHNPEIDWAKGEWRYTRCPESCAPKARKTNHDPEDLQMAEFVASILNKDVEEEDADTTKWKSLIPEYLHEFGMYSHKRNRSGCQSANHTTMVLTSRKELPYLDRPNYTRCLRKRGILSTSGSTANSERGIFESPKAR
ncbi:hypothetical protein IEO21_10902 [Rhodonia placenta]|uniref:Uncharacterized protein n=1 Tax=Rhodonia placenta TaxID=104341 RepID=A0A8H7NRK6_9APHY|nr:hypothetical protein IEO21_10902 [Postia placenta]